MFTNLYTEYRLKVRFKIQFHVVDANLDFFFVIRFTRSCYMSRTNICVCVVARCSLLCVSIKI